MIWGTDSFNVARISRESISQQPKSGNVQILFVAPSLRIDNAEALKAALNLTSDSTNADLIQSAWRRWGRDMAHHLKGAFAFALFDSASHSIYAARDIFGLCPLYYSLDDQRFIVAESSGLVRALCDDNPALDKLMLADFIAGTVIETERTFFQSILRLPSAHTLSISSEDVALSRYWAHSDVPRDDAPDDIEIAFRDAFDKSVRRSHHSGKTTLMLSGGLDSSAIAASLHANGIGDSPIPALSMTYDETKGWNDGPHLEAMSQHCEIELHKVPSDDHDPLSDMEHWLRVMDGPYLPPGHSVSFRLLPLASKLGYTHVFSGHGGDENVSHGFGRLNELGKQRRWLTLWRELAGAQNLYGGSRPALFRRYLSHIPLIRKIERRLARRKKTTANPRQPVDNQNISKSLSREIDAGRYTPNQPKRRLDHDERMLHEHALTHPVQTLSLEVFDICARASGVTVHMPFYDQELMELSLRAPSEWKLRKGQTRFLLRESLRGRVPETVRLRQDKFDFSRNFQRGLFRNPDCLLKLTDPETSSLDEYVNIDRLRALRDRIRAGEASFSNPEAFFLWRVAVLGLWLAISSDKPEKPAMIPLGSSA